MKRYLKLLLLLLMTAWGSGISITHFPPTDEEQRSVDQTSVDQKYGDFLNGQRPIISDEPRQDAYSGAHKGYRNNPPITGQPKQQYHEENPCKRHGDVPVCNYCSREGQVIPEHTKNDKSHRSHHSHRSHRPKHHRKHHDHDDDSSRRHHSSEEYHNNSDYRGNKHHRGHSHNRHDQRLHGHRNPNRNNQRYQKNDNNNKTKNTNHKDTGSNQDSESQGNIKILNHDYFGMRINGERPDKNIEQNVEGYNSRNDFQRKPYVIQDGDYKKINDNFDKSNTRNSEPAHERLEKNNQLTVQPIFSDTNKPSYEPERNGNVDHVDSPIAPPGNSILKLGSSSSSPVVSQNDNKNAVKLTSVYPFIANKDDPADDAEFQLDVRFREDDDDDDSDYESDSDDDDDDDIPPLNKSSHHRGHRH